MNVMNVSEWEVSGMKYQNKRMNDKNGSASVSILNGRTNRGLYLGTPEMMTWGIADYVDESGKSNEKYTLSLAFSSSPSSKEEEFLSKLKEFENKLLDDAVSNSELWWGEPMTKEVLKHMYFPFLKYPKIKGTKKDDMSKPPTLRAKVPYFNGQWGDSFAIFSDKKEKLFPSETARTPVDLIPKMSNIRCVLHISGLWFGGKGWGLTIRATQAVVRPSDMRMNINDVCQIGFGDDEEDIQKQVKEDKVNTVVYDSDEEQVPVQAQAPVKAPEPKPEPKAEPQVVAVVEETTAAPVAAAPKKKIVKKASA